VFANLFSFRPNFFAHCELSALRNSIAFVCWDSILPQHHVSLQAGVTFHFESLGKKDITRTKQIRNLHEFELNRKTPTELSNLASQCRKKTPQLWNYGTRFVLANIAGSK